jgi:protein disulfide-isomerase-like protein
LSEFFEKGRKDEIKRAFQDKSIRPSKIYLKNAVKLNDENYEEVLQSNRLVFVEFYSPDCGHCIKFAPIYEKLATKFQQANSKVVIAAVDGSSEQEISESINLRGFPTLKLFVNGEPIDYNGDRSVEKMTEFINGFLRARLIPVASLEKVEKPAVVAWGVSTEDSLIKLTALYTTYPVYRIEGEENSEFRIEIHDGTEVRTYNGKK